MKMVLLAPLLFGSLGATPILADDSTDLSRYVLAVTSNYRFGSGVAVSDRRIATACHTLQGANRATVTNRDGTVRQVTERGMSRPGKDVCLLHFDIPHGFPVPPLGVSSRLAVGAMVTAIGYSHGQLSAASGPVRGKTAMLGGGEVINSDTPVFPGASGGGLFDADGRLAGIIIFITNDSNGRRIGNYSVPIEWANELNHVQPYALWALYRGGEFWRTQY